MTSYLVIFRFLASPVYLMMGSRLLIIGMSVVRCLMMGSSHLVTGMPNKAQRTFPTRLLLFHNCQVLKVLPESLDTKYKKYNSDKHTRTSLKNLKHHRNLVIKLIVNSWCFHLPALRFIFVCKKKLMSMVLLAKM